jgi:hypothetical protein
MFYQVRTWSAPINDLEPKALENLGNSAPLVINEDKSPAYLPAGEEKAEKGNQPKMPGYVNIGNHFFSFIADVCTMYHFK